MKYLGVDYGTRRIGMAVSDETASVAFPLTTLAAGQGAADAVLALAREHGADTVVLGESRDFAGAANPVMREIERFQRQLAERGLSVVLEPELLTSAAAARQWEVPASRKARPSHEGVDAAAAALILQSYLDRLKTRPEVE